MNNQLYLWWVSGDNWMVLKHWSDCLCHVASGRTHNRIRSPRWTASSFWVYAGKGSRQIRSVSLVKGLAQTAAWVGVYVREVLLVFRHQHSESAQAVTACMPSRLTAKFELTRTRRIRLFNKNIALWWTEKVVDTMWFLPSALNVNVEKFKKARVNGGSNYDSLKVAKCLVI